MPDTPELDPLQVSSAAQYKALGHPFRQRLLFALAQRSATISQLAAGLDAKKGNVAHHLGVLREAGLVHVVETRQVRGGTEQYYRRIDRRIDLSGTTAAGRHEPTAALLSAVADDIAASGREPMLSLRHLRLSAAQAEKLTATLAELVDGAQDAGDDEPRYGVLAVVYGQSGDDRTH
ncbi:MAG: ArsR family transcriptional regulator [Actinocatenispora sp.]